MIHFIINRDEPSEKLENFFTEFTNFISSEEILVLNIDPIELNMLNMFNIPISKCVLLDTSKVVICDLNVVYSKYLKYISQLKSKIKEIIEEPKIEDKNTQNLSILKEVIGNCLNVTVTGISTEDVLTRFNSNEEYLDNYNCGIITLFSKEKDKIENGIHYFYVDLDDPKFILPEIFFMNILKTLKKEILPITENK